VTSFNFRSNKCGRLIFCASSLVLPQTKKLVGLPRVAQIFRNMEAGIDCKVVWGYEFCG
jgi:hypothetical protein